AVDTGGGARRRGVRGTAGGALGRRRAGLPRTGGQLAAGGSAHRRDPEAQRDAVEDPPGPRDPHGARPSPRCSCTPRLPVGNRAAPDRSDSRRSHTPV
ncbi:MAG: hypothetical protein AVDCRST_MAG66-2880, partial [uncultured Pseudonocardia sp.]